MQLYNWSPSGRWYGLQKQVCKPFIRLHCSLNMFISQICGEIAWKPGGEFNLKMMWFSGEFGVGELTNYCKVRNNLFYFSSSLAFSAASCTFSFVSFQTGRVLWATLHLCARTCQQVTLKDKRNCVPNYNFSRYASIWDIPIFTTGGKPLIEIYWQLEV